MNQQKNTADFLRTLEGISIEELNEIACHVQQIIEEKLHLQKQQAIEELRSTASKYGFDLVDLISSELNARISQDAIRYFVHPDNPNLTWMGRGRHPNWLRELTRRGIKPRIAFLEHSDF